MNSARHFKLINDERGHAAGDEALQALEEAFAPPSLVARLGGEEFAVLLPGFDGTQALRAAEQLCLSVRSMAAPFPGSLTVSCGAAQVAGPGLADALDRAGSAMYRAKAEGRDGVRLA